MNSNMTEQLDQLFRMWDRGLCPVLDMEILKIN